VSCQECKGIKRIDGIDPPCRQQGGPGCKILLDRLGHLEIKAMTVRRALMHSGRLVGQEAILRRYEVDERDLDLVMAIEDELARIRAEADDE
jgi:hypothetical protein